MLNIPVLQTSFFHKLNEIWLIIRLKGRLYFHLTLLRSKLIHYQKLEPASNFSFWPHHFKYEICFQYPQSLSGSCRKNRQDIAHLNTVFGDTNFAVNIQARNVQRLQPSHRTILFVSYFEVRNTLQALFIVASHCSKLSQTGLDVKRILFCERKKLRDLHFNGFLRSFCKKCQEGGRSGTRWKNMLIIVSMAGKHTSSVIYLVHSRWSAHHLVYERRRPLFELEIWSQALRSRDPPFCSINGFLICPKKNASDGGRLFTSWSVKVGGGCLDFLWALPFAWISPFLGSSWASLLACFCMRKISSGHFKISKATSGTKFFTLENIKKCLRTVSQCGGAVLKQEYPTSTILELWFCFGQIGYL